MLGELEGIRVLLVEDDPSLVRMMRLALRAEGFQVTTANDGIEGLECLDAAPEDFAVIVLDMQMPRLDGRGFYRQMRDRGYETPVVVLSAYDADQARIDLQAEASISKPFDPRDLIATISRLAPSAGEESGNGGASTFDNGRA
ncbi:MAG TPA: response regulator transcription factor [Dehalococcoidia bacterium]|nr:response regulator transcription factor [Dehalococcoidia bacterium]